MIKEMIKGCIKVIKKEYRKEFPKVVGYCRYCNRPIFNEDSKWCREGVCVCCYSAYQEGLKKGRKRSPSK